MSRSLNDIFHCGAAFLSQHAAYGIGLSAVSHAPLITSAWGLSAFLFLWFFGSFGYLGLAFAWGPATLFLFFGFGFIIFCNSPRIAIRFSRLLSIIGFVTHCGMIFVYGIMFMHFTIREIR